MSNFLPLKGILALAFAIFLYTAFRIDHIAGNFFVSSHTLELQALGCLLFLSLLGIPFKTNKTEWVWKNSASFLSVGILLFLFFLSLVFINQKVLLRFFHSADEFSCYFFAQCLLRGQWWGEPFPFPNAVGIPHIGDMAAKRFSVYPPGWPMVWALALKLRIGDFINPLLSVAGLAVWGHYMGRWFSWKTVVLSFFLILCSPFFTFTSAAYYSHSLCFFLWAVFIACIAEWYKSKNPFWAVLAGSILGFGFAVRYLTMAALAFPFAAFFAFTCLSSFSKHWKSFFLFGFSFIAICAAHAFYNFQITGSFFDFPNHFARSHEKLGFILGYTPALAFEYLFKRVLYLMDWTPPLVVLTGLAGLFALPFRSQWDKLLRCSLMLVPAAYFFYYSWGGNQFGPRYYYEGYPILCLLAVEGIRFIGNKLSETKPHFTSSLIYGIILLSFPIYGFWIQEYTQISKERKSFFEAAESQTQKPALIFVSGFFGDKLVMSSEDMLRNGPGWNDPVIFALDLGKEENQKIIELFPDRTIYAGSYDRTVRMPVLSLQKSEEKSGSPVDSK